MHIETSADARRSRRHDAGGGRAGPAADDRGYLAAAASRLSLWWSGTSRPQALTADTASGAGLQGGNEGEVRLPNGDAITAPSADGYPRTQPILVAQQSVPVAGQEAGLETNHRAPLRSGAARPLTGPAEALRGVAADSQSPRPVEPRQGATAEPEAPEGLDHSLTPVACLPVDTRSVGPRSTEQRFASCKFGKSCNARI